MTMDKLNTQSQDFQYNEAIDWKTQNKNLIKILMWYKQEISIYFVKTLTHNLKKKKLLMIEMLLGYSASTLLQFCHIVSPF